MEKGGAKYSHFAARSPQNEEAGQHALVGVSPLFQQVLNVVDAVASNDSVVLLEGESGTGKELLARRIHALSSRSRRPFIPVNCAGISETLFESQFFGHVRGAFTGASTDTLGVVRAADGGTLLLDEVGELPLQLQPKLLRLVQEREVIPVGAAKPVSVDVRFIASTNRSLAKAVTEGTFRSDLYHRLNIVRIVSPPLRARPEDIEPTVDYYLDYFAGHYRMSRRELGTYLRSHLRSYPWPGNVRELSAYVERLYAANLPPLPPGGLVWDDGYRSYPKPVEPAPDRMPLPAGPNVTFSLAEVEANAILQALAMTNNNRSAAARLLQIHRSTLLRKIRQHGLSNQDRPSQA